MILLVLLVVIFAVAIGSRRTSGDHPVSAFDPLTAILAGSIIAIVRVGAFLMGVGWLQYSDGRQGAGYVLVLFTAIFELVMVSWGRSWRGWTMLVSALIVATSFVLGWAWAWTRARPDLIARRRTPPGVLEIVGRSMLVALAGYFVWGILLMAGIVHYDSVVRLLSVHPETSWVPLIILAPPTAVALTFGVVMAMRNRP